MPVQFVMLLLLAMQDAPSKSAWEWTNEERIAARKDPLLRIQRREAAFAAGDLERSDKRDVLPDAAGDLRRLLRRELTSAEFGLRRR